MKRVEKITSIQLLTMIFITKLFFFMMYTPKMEIGMESTVYMIGQLCSIPFIFLSLLPFYYLNTNLPNYNIMECGKKVNFKFGKIIGMLYYFYMIFSVVNTLINFDFYLSSAVYPESKSYLFIIIITAACAYCGVLGIEPLARFSGFVIIALIISGAMIFLPLVSKVNLSFIHIPRDMGLKDFAKAVYMGIISNNEIVFLYIFADKIKGNASKGIGKYILTSVGFYELVAFFTVAIFGAYEKTVLFPLYSLSGVASLSILERTESVHVAIWVFVAFVKLSLLLIAAGKLLTGFIKMGLDKGVIISSAISLILALLISKSFKILHYIRIFMYTGVLFGIFIVVLPTMVAVSVKINGVRKN